MTQRNPAIASSGRGVLELLAAQLVGVAEVAELLDMSRRQVLRWVRRSSFPTEIARVAAGPLWLRSEIELWRSRYELECDGFRRFLGDAYVDPPVRL